MAIRIWTTQFPANLDTTAQQPPISNYLDEVDATHVNALAEAVRALEALVGSNNIESGSLRDLVNQVPTTTFANLNSKITDATLITTNDSRLADQRSANKIQGRTISSTAPTHNQALLWNNGLLQWEPGAPVADLTPLTFSQLNAKVIDATLVDTGDSRLSDARTPLAHTHTASSVTDFDTEVSNNTDVASNTSHRGSTSNPHSVTAAQVGNATAQWNANKLQGRDISASVPSSGQVLAWNTAEVAWTDGGGGDFSAYEDVFTADSPDGNNRQTFTLTVTASINANTPSGRNIVGVYRNGIKQKYIASNPGNREYSVPAGNQVTVGGLITNDEIEIVYGG